MSKGVFSKVRNYTSQTNISISSNFTFVYLSVDHLYWNELLLLYYQQIQTPTSKG